MFRFKFIILLLFLSSNLYAEVQWVDETSEKRRKEKKQNIEFLPQKTIKKKK